MTEQAVEILLIEDSPNDIELTLRAFEKNNLANRVCVLRDGAEALEYLFGDADGESQAPLPRVILLDIKLPLVDGLEVLSRIKQDERTRKVPVVMLTSSHEDQDIEQCYALGVNSYIVKPVEFSAFVKAISNLGMYWCLLNRLPKEAG